MIVRDNENPDAKAVPPSPLAGEKVELKASPRLVDHRAKIRRDHPSRSTPTHDRNYHQSDVPILKRPLG
jgi:hypothetical protein